MFKVDHQRKLDGTETNTMNRLKAEPLLRLHQLLYDGSFFHPDSSIQGGAHLSEDEMALLLSKFEASTVCHGDATISDKRKGGGKGEELATCMDYDAFVRWLSQGGLDNAVLLKVQWHIKGRLNK